MNNMLDNAAASRPFPWAVELFAEKSLELYANQESAGVLGTAAAGAVKAAAEQLASAVAPGFGVLFCNTGTEALRAAVQGVLAGAASPDVLTTRGEHPALINALKQYAVPKYCKLGKEGLIHQVPEGKFHLFATHHVNSETGILQDPEYLRGLLHNGTPFLLDTTQSVCKVPVPSSIPDFLTISGCKIGAPCGAALLYRKTFEKQILRIRQELHGTGRCIPAAAVVLAEVVSRGVSELEAGMKHAEKLGEILRQGLSDLPVVFTAAGSKASPWIVHLLLPGYQGGILVRMLNERGITAAAGSACSSETPEPSAVLRAMGYTSEEAYSSLRISFFHDTTENEVLFFINTLHELLKNY